MLWYACDWICDHVPINRIGEFFDIAADLDCLLLHKGFLTEKGYEATTFLLRVSSQEVLHKFIELAGKRIGAVNWFPTELDPEIIAQLPDKMIRFSDMAGGYQTGIVEGFMEAAWRNKKRRQELNDWD